MKNVIFCFVKLYETTNQSWKGRGNWGLFPVSNFPRQEGSASIWGNFLVETGESPDAPLQTIQVERANLKRYRQGTKESENMDDQLLLISS